MAVYRCCLEGLILKCFHLTVGPATRAFVCMNVFISFFLSLSVCLKKGEFRPKQSLGQNYLSDQNYVLKICNHFGDTSERGRRVVELGPGTGALTQVRAACVKSVKKDLVSRSPG